MFKPYLMVGSVFILCTSLFSQSFSFPQASAYAGTIKPDHRTQDQLNSDVTSYYNSWKSSYLKSSSKTSGGYYVFTDGETDGITVSEAHGYGMVITALMAGYDSNAKNYYDGMYKFYKDHPSELDDDLMCWTISSSETSNSTAATDGDMDIAYSLLLAHYQWGSTSGIDYLSEAKRVIAAIKRSEMSTYSKRTLLGDWDDDDYSTRSSDWMAGHMRAYADVTGDNFWNAAADTIYSLIKQVRNNSTGLLPDFVVYQNAQPAPPGFLEGSNDGNYNWNACRDPWRIATDYAHFQTAAAKEQLMLMLDFIIDDCAGDPLKISNGYTLNGGSLNNSWDAAGAFMSPFVSAAIVDSKYQGFLNDGWDAMRNSDDGYFSNSITLLNMLLVSGNWWIPVEGGGPTPNCYCIDVQNGGANSLNMRISENEIKLSGNFIIGQNLSARIFNLSGKLVREVNSLNSIHSQISLKDLSTGSYLLKVKNRNGIKTRNFTIVR